MCAEKFPSFSLHSAAFAKYFIPGGDKLLSPRLIFSVATWNTL